MTKLSRYLADLFGFAGVAAVVFGVHQIYPPAGWIVLGVALIAIAVLQRNEE